MGRKTEGPELVYVCPCSKRDIRNLFRSSAARFSTLTRTSRWWVRKRHNAIRTRRKIRPKNLRAIPNPRDKYFAHTYVCVLRCTRREIRVSEHVNRRLHVLLCFMLRFVMSIVYLSCIRIFFFLDRKCLTLNFQTTFNASWRLHHISHNRYYLNVHFFCE